MKTSCTPLHIKRFVVQYQLDCTAPAAVEIVLDKDGQRIWVNAEGVCLLRVCRAGLIELFDNRQAKLALGNVPLCSADTRTKDFATGVAQAEPTC